MKKLTRILRTLFLQPPLFICCVLSFLSTKAMISHSSIAWNRVTVLPIQAICQRPSACQTKYKTIPSISSPLAWNCIFMFINFYMYSIRFKKHQPKIGYDQIRCFFFGWRKYVASHIRVSVIWEMRIGDIGKETWFTWKLSSGLLENSRQPKGRGMDRRVRPSGKYSLATSLQIDRLSGCHDLHEIW